jgi:hypothetical protein
MKMWMCLSENVNVNVTGDGMACIEEKIGGASSCMSECWNIYSTQMQGVDELRVSRQL